MTNVVIHGRFGDIVGKSHDFACSNLSEVFHALEHNTGKVRKYLKYNKKRSISVFVDGQAVQNKNFELVNVKNKKVVILPMLMGSVGFTIVLAVTGATMATIKVGAVIAAMVINMAFAIGMSLLMSKLLAPDSPDVASTSSYVFGQAENVTRQGTPVPVGYGRFRVGSTIISASMTNVDKSIVTQNSFYDDVFKDTIETSAVEKNSVEIVSSAIAKNT